MDRHKLERLRSKVGELLRFGSSSCIAQAHGIMTTEFENVLSFALKETEPKPKPQHTIADNYPAGGIPEPCMFCENYEELENKNTELQAENKSLKDQLLTPCVTCNAFIENENLKEAIQAIINHEEARKKCGCGYDLFVHDTAVEAIIF